jgi:lactate dehydrogenase-like 2-hydroxyacid dehydrogenase
VKENDLKIRGCSGRNVIDVMSNLGNTLYGKTLGLIGMGNIAQAVARRAKVFGLKIIYYSRHRVDLSVESNLSLEWRESMSDLLRDADIISLHIPAVSKNKLMSEQEFKLMKPNSVLINTARGALVDEGALIKALKEHWIYGAALDVFENEDEINPQLLMLDNVLLSPHNGTGTIEARVQSAMKASLNIYNYFYLDKKDLNAV